jgi:hypothetical protein
MKKTDTPGLLLCTLRVVGGATFVAPAAGARTFHIADGAEETYLVRLFAARNMALTAGLFASKGKARRLWYQVGIACDVLDIGAGLLGFRAGKKRSSAAIDTGAALIATLLGVTGLLIDREQEEISG